MGSGGDSTAVAPDPVAPQPGGAGTLRVAGFAAVFAVAAIVAAAALEGPLEGMFFFPAFAAIIVVALLHGFRASLVAIAVSAAGFAVLLAGAGGGVGAPAAVYRLVGSTATAVAVAWLAARAHAAVRSERAATRRAAALADSERRARELSERLRAEAEQLSRVKEQLLAVVGHDLRNPLSAIVNGAAVMLRRRELTAADAATLRRIASSADRMSGVIRDLLDFSRVRQGLGLPVELASVDLGEVAREVIAEFEERPQPRPVELRAAGDLHLVADRQRMAQTISNLVGNALQHGEGPSPVTVELAARPDAVVLRVHNAGRPIDPGVLPQLFEPFRRGGAGPGGAADGGSVGLGLFIVAAIVKAHAGDVRVESSEGAGTTFVVSLPRLGEAPRGPAAT